MNFLSDVDPAIRCEMPAHRMKVGMPTFADSDCVKKVGLII